MLLPCIRHLPTTAIALAVFSLCGACGEPRPEARARQVVGSAQASLDDCAQTRAPAQSLILAQLHVDHSRAPRRATEEKAKIEFDEAEEGSQWAIALPAGIGVLLGAILVSCVIWPHVKEGPEGAVAALVAGVVAHHMEGIVFTYILADSLALSRSFGKDAEFSGFLLGVHKMGTATGSCLTWGAMQRYGDFWRNGRALFRFAVAAQFAGALAFAVVANEVSVLDRSDILQVMLVSRFAAGFGGGVIIFTTLTLIGRIVLPEARRAWNVWFFLAGVSGLGVGPLIAATVRKAQMLLGSPQKHLIRNGLAMLPLLPLVQIPCLIFYPDLGAASDLSSRNETFKMANTSAQSSLVLMCVLMQVLRNLSISSLEAGTPMILETDHQWDSASTGLTVAAVVGSVIFANSVYRALADKMSPYMQQHVMNLAILAGAAMIVFCRSPWLLLIGVTIGFTASALSGGLIMASLQQHVLPAGYFCDLNKSMLLAVVGADLLGRGGGPILARTVLSWGGQSAFAVVQVCLGAGIMVLHEVSSFIANSLSEDSDEDSASDIDSSVETSAALSKR